MPVRSRSPSRAASRSPWEPISPSPDPTNAWGSNGAELVHLVKLGMTPLQAIKAATATAPLTLGPQAPKSGRLQAGYDADVITVGADPLADISVLARPEHVTAVW